jgi:hypothetical protein
MIPGHAEHSEMLVMSDDTHTMPMSGSVSPFVLPPLPHALPKPSFRRHRKFQECASPEPHYYK